VVCVLLAAVVVWCVVGCGGADGGTTEPAPPPEPAPPVAPDPVAPDPVAPDPVEPLTPPEPVTDCPTQDVAGDLELRESCTVPTNVLVDGRISIENGALTVIGTVNGSVRQIGDGGILIRAQGVVTGNVTEENSGAVRVEGGAVSGDITESGKGAVLVESGSRVEGSIAEDGRGNVRIREGTEIGGDIAEGGRGNCDISQGANVTGTAAGGCNLR